jgi:UDP-N-acetyl-2-amino-2-deoxyglucuronate dehydrogenase
VKLGVVLQRRSESMYKAVHDAIQGGDLGQLTVGGITLPYRRAPTYYGQAPWRGTWAMDGGGVLMNQGIHMLDLLLWFMGDPVEIQASAATLVRQIEVEDTLVATLKFVNGAMATITATNCAGPGFPHRLELYGNNGGIQVEGEAIVRWELVDASKATIERPTTETPVTAGASSDPRGIAPTGHINFFADFIQAINDNRLPCVDGVEGRRSVAAVLGIYEAAGIRKKV